MRTYFIFMHSPKKFAKAAMWHTGVEPADAAAANWVAAGDPAKQRARAKIAIFFILAVSFAGILYFVRALVPSGTTFGILIWTPRLADALAMWSVGFAGCIALIIIDRSLGDLGLKVGSPKYVILALTLPIVYGVAVYVPVWTFQLGRFAGASMLRAAIVSAVIHSPLHLLAAAGEELGWRGVLVPNLARTADAKYVAFLPGAIWALWHYPDILFFDYNVGTPWPFALIYFSVSPIGQSAFLSRLRLASGSILPAVAFHGVHNSVIWDIFDRVTERSAVTVYISTEFGAGLSVIGAALGYLFWSKVRSLGIENPKG